MKIHKIVTFAILLCLTVLLAGCGEQDVNVLINNGKNTVQNGVDGVQSGYSMVTNANWAGMWLYSCFVVKRWVPVIMVGSFLSGYLGYRLFRRNREVQKFALTTLMLYIPIAAFIFGYAYCGVYGAVNGSVMPEGVQILLPDARTGLFAAAGVGMIPEIWYNISTEHQFVIGLITVLSIISGCIVNFVFTTNKEIQKFAKGSLILGNVVLFISFGFIYPGLYGIFNF